MSTTTLRLSYGTSRGRDTYGYRIVRIDDVSTGKRYRCMGGGYDMVGTVVADWLQDVHQSALRAIAGCAHASYPDAPQNWDRVENTAGLYGMTYAVGRVTVNGACGLSSVLAIAEAAGVEIVRATWDSRGNTTSWTASA